MKKTIALMMVMVLVLTLAIGGVASAKKRHHHRHRHHHNTTGRTFQCNDVPCIGARGNDRIFERNGSVQDDIDGLEGNDVISANVAGGDADTVNGGPGDDRINVADGDGRDTVDCGSGFDRVEADRGDTISGNCEVVSFSTRPTS